MDEYHEQRFVSTARGKVALSAEVGRILEVHEVSVVVARA